MTPPAARDKASGARLRWWRPSCGGGALERLERALTAVSATSKNGCGVTSTTGRVGRRTAGSNPWSHTRRGKPPGGGTCRSGWRFPSQRRLRFCRPPTPGRPGNRVVGGLGRFELDAHGRIWVTKASSAVPAEAVPAVAIASPIAAAPSGLWVLPWMTSASGPCLAGFSLTSW